MSMGEKVDFSLMRRSESSLDDLGGARWDLFISAYNSSERVRTVFDRAAADEKHWLVHREYGFLDSDLPTNAPVFAPEADGEAGFWLEYFAASGLPENCSGLRICVDSTGFMRPHLLVMLKLLWLRGVALLSVLYSDPLSYESGETTVLSKGPVTVVRQVQGFEGAHVADAGESDLLVIGTGYDEALIRRVAEDRMAARKLQMFGLPSLQPHMYQENQLQVYKASESLGKLPERSGLYAPANNPFITAAVLNDAVVSEIASRGVSNLYLSPLGTKPQVLGFGLYYMALLQGEPASIVFPFAEQYTQESSLGLARVWRYEVELDWGSAGAAGRV